MKQQLICPMHEHVIERDDTVKGYEVSKGQYVVFSDEELAKLEAESTNTIDIVEFVPAASVDFMQIEKTNYLGPDKGGHKAYNLLGQAMRDTEVVAIGRYNARGKSYVVMIRPYQEGPRAAPAVLRRRGARVRRGRARRRRALLERRARTSPRS